MPHRRRRPRHRSTKEDAFEEATLTFQEARRTCTFWLLTAGGVCVGTLGTGLLFHHFSMLEADGIDRMSAAALFVPLGIGTAAARLGTGVLVDRSSPHLLLGAKLHPAQGDLA